MEKKPEKTLSEEMPATNMMPEKTGGSKVWMIVAIIAILALIGLGIYGFMSMKKLNQQIKDQQTQIDELSNSKKTLEDAAAAAAKSAVSTVISTSAGSDDDQVTTATKNYCEALVNPNTGKPRVFAMGTTGPNGKKVVYASNKTFARVNADCTYTGVQEGSGSAYISKKVNGTWVVIDVGQQENPEATKNFGIPNNFN